MSKLCNGVLIVVALIAAVCATQGRAAEKNDATIKNPPIKRTANGIIGDIRKKGTLVVAQVGAEQPPFFWLEKHNGKEKWVGYEIDLAADIAKRLGVKLEILRLGDDYNEVCRAVAQGRADIGISSLSDTEARREWVDFTQPYIVSRVAMLVAIDALENEGLEIIEPKDLNDPRVKVALPVDSGYEFVVDEVMPKATRIAVQLGDFNTVAKPVIEGKAHVLPDDGFTLHLGMMQNPELAARLHLHVFDEYDDPLSIALPHGQADLREFMNTIIREIENIEPVTLEYLLEKYMK